MLEALGVAAGRPTAPANPNDLELRTFVDEPLIRRTSFYATY
jgi:hypothetical protein